MPDFEINSREFPGFRATRGGLLREVRDAVPHAQVGLVEPRDVVWVPPRTLWERIVQVFKGPRMVTRMGVAHVAVITARPLSDQQREDVIIAIESHRAAGVLIELKEYQS